ncbi:MFS transporter [Sphingomonas sp. BGYR3]|uniref:AmpG family muropeptide MFS transporter n=1 Tax=Sphingomonas sp. BGYR3 TaxID=2975483 RepID=UPI0021A27980|nr:MFS transporter [Sphingomonas sp. BGYR3]MDG5487431.1 MFS transporter [Sphingomonas sp. BGYR3]
MALERARLGFSDALRPYLERAPLAALALGISSGFPFAMIGATLTTRLTEEGVTRATVTAFALTFLAYNLKWAWAPIVDKFEVPLLGRIGQRRSWLIVAGAFVIAAVVFLGSVDPKSDLAMTVVAAILVGFAGATFDIVIDAYRIELLEPRQLGIGSGMSQYGWRIGSAAAGALALLAADWSNWHVAYGLCSLFALPAVLTGLLVGEPERKVIREWPERMGRRSYLLFILSFVPIYLAGVWIDRVLGTNILGNLVLAGYLFPLFDLTARRLRDAGRSGRLAWLCIVPIAAIATGMITGWTSIEAMLLIAVSAALLLFVASLASRDAIDRSNNRVDPFVEFFRREGALIALLFVVLHKLGDTLANLSLRLLFADLGFTKPEIAYFDVVVGFVALLLGIFVGGVLYAWLGMKRSVMISLILMAISNLSFAGLAVVGHDNLAMAAAMSFENFSSGIGGVAVVAYLSALCNLSFTATQFALFSAAASILGRFLSGTLAGKMIDGMGFVNFYVLTFVVALPGILLFAWMMFTGLVDRTVTAGTKQQPEPGPEQARAATE